MADIRHITLGEHEQVADLLAEAFLEGPVAEWLISDRGARLETYRTFFRVFVSHVAAHGVVHVTDDLSGAALWLDETGDGSPPIENYEQALAGLHASWTDRAQLKDSTFASVHPQKPHWYLMFIGVLPSKHSQGIGSKLLDFGHQAFSGSPCYLVASNMRNRGLYERHYYKPMTTRGVMLPDNGPPVWPMWRNA